MKPTDDRYEVLQRNYLEQLNHDRIDHLQQSFSKLQTERNKWNFINEQFQQFQTNKNRNRHSPVSPDKLLRWYYRGSETNCKPM